MKLVLVVMVVAGMVGTAVGADRQPCQQKDHLFAFKDNLGDGPFFHDWKGTTDCCNWTGITCNVGGMVTKIDIRTSDPSVGIIPDNLGKFSALDTLYIGYNLPNITGSIPEGIKNLTNLKTLSIVGTKLSSIVPQVLGKIPILEVLDLSNNHFIVGVDSLANAAMLKSLNLSNNLLSTLPATLPPALKALNLSGNNLEGKITAEIVEKWGSLEVVDISHNRLKGSPEPLFAVGKSLKYLSLASNHFWFNMSAAVLPTGLTDLDLSHNQIFWTISEQVNDLKNLANFTVSNNLLFGAIPSGLSNKPPSAFDNNFCLCGPPLNDCPCCIASSKPSSRGDAPIIRPTSTDHDVHDQLPYRSYE